MILKELNVSSSRIKDFSAGMKIEQTDSIIKSDYNDRSIKDLLSENNCAYIKSYGPGGLSTISLRGGSAYHTSVLWNGIPLANQMHGLTDLQLSKNIFFDDIILEYGGSSSIWGSGAVSGAILLNNSPLFNSGFTATAGISVASFSDFAQSIRTGFGNKNVYSSVRYFHRSGKNNFNYYDSEKQEKKTSDQSELSESGFMIDLYFLSSANNLITLRSWHSESEREIASGINVTNTDAVQKDLSDKYSLEWKHSMKKSELFIRTSLSEEKINYDDDFLLQPSLSNCRTIYNQASLKYQLNSNHIIESGVDHSYTYANPTDYSKAVNLNRIAPFMNYQYISKNNNFQFSTSLRKEFSSLQNSGLIVNAGSDYSIFKKIKLRVSAATVYRNPTLNDLYWSPGGNENLKPEQGFSSEAGINTVLNSSARTETSISLLTVDACIYYKSIEDWITWYPTGAFYWSPQNIQLVKSRGTETTINYTRQSSRINYGVNFSFSYTISTNEKTKFANDASFKKQLIYVPFYRWNSSAFISYKEFRIKVNYSFTGNRFTTTDNSSILKSYYIGNILIEKNFLHTSYRIKIFARCNNILNTDYQTLLNRPMPLRNYETGINLTLK